MVKVKHGKFEFVVAGGICPCRIVFIDHCVNMQCQKHSNPKFDLDFDPKINRGPPRVMGNITVF